jgi:hypothetical protein
MANTNDVINEMLRMERHWRRLITRKQMENVFDYYNNLMHTLKDLIKKQADHFYLRDGGKESFHRRRCEIALYRLIGEIPWFFLNRDLGQSHKMIDKLLSISEYWRFLE